jgi:hypothetical protein
MQKVSEENSRIWFKAKSYGWGWYPCTWQGWGVIVLYLIGIAGVNLGMSDGEPVGMDWLSFALPMFVLTAFLIIISYVTGEKPSWRWGNK